MGDLEVLVEKQRIVETITDLFVATDRRDWPAVLACFAPRVHFDMSSLTGAAPSTLPAEDIVAGWEKGLAPMKAVHHQAGNFKVRLDGDEADAFCYAIATHYLPSPSGRNTRTFVGSYDFRLKREGRRWRITRFRFDVKYVDGNLELEKSA
jgi:3-phenylpropionate/cinnamic acid dioxygenase small subunit